MNFIEANLRRPAWLLRKVGSAYLFVLGLMKQGMLEAQHEAQRMGRPATAPPDALPWLARGRGQAPGYAGESDAAIRHRIGNAFPSARGRGWAAGLLDELARVGYPNARIEDELDDPALEWWQFRVVLERPFPFDDRHLADGVWGDPGTWGDGGVWAGAMPLSHLKHLRGIIRKGRATHSRCVAIRVIYDATNPLDRIDLVA